MTDTLIKVEGVSKKFCRSLKRSLWYGLQDLGSELRGHRHGGNGELRPDEFWAVKDVNFELKRGECLGLIGRNGAGKTTLLRMLNGLIKPDQGRIEMRGRVGALIALGAGFNPILTGRENIYINASVLGLSKQAVDAKLEEIIDFAEISDFIDTPVQNYSSGMSVRLGFAVASKLEPDILLVDEVLAVGDGQFRIKCYNAIHNILKNAAVIFVSHSMAQVAKVCTHGLHMRYGIVTYGPGAVETAIAHYQENLTLGPPRVTAVEGAAIHRLTVSTNGGSGRLTQILDLSADALAADKTPERQITLDATCQYEIAIHATIPSRYVSFVALVSIEDGEQRLIMQMMSDALSRGPYGGDEIVVQAVLDRLPLNNGRYFLHCEFRSNTLSQGGLHETILHAVGIANLHVNSRLFPGVSSVQLPALWSCERFNPKVHLDLQAPVSTASAEEQA